MVSQEPPLDPFSSNIVASFGRSQKRAVAFGRRPVLNLYLMKQHPQVLLEVPCWFILTLFWCFLWHPGPGGFWDLRWSPESPKTNDSYNCGTFPIRHPELLCSTMLTIWAISRISQIQLGRHNTILDSSCFAHTWYRKSAWRRRNTV